jgi:predicted RNA-binding protein with PUA domain
VVTSASHHIVLRSHSTCSPSDHSCVHLQVVTKRGDYTEVDVKRYVRIEKIPGGELSECIVLDGVMFNKVLRLC